jgi:transposase-like protein
MNHVDIVEMYMAGEKMQDIADHYGISIRTAYNWLHELGVETNKLGGRPRKEPTCTCEHCGKVTRVNYEEKKPEEPNRWVCTCGTSLPGKLNTCPVCGESRG